MSTTSAKSEKMKLAPVRSMNDFLLDSKRYLSPPFNDLKRFNNRVTSNLLYYQTNYFAFSGAVLAIFLIFRFNRLLLGGFGIASAVVFALFALNRIPQASSVRRQYPVAIYGAWALDVLIVYMTFRPIMFLSLVVLIPFLFWILHAATRSRGIKNKVSNKMEQLGANVYNNTPMGFALLSLGFEVKECDD